MRRRVTSAMGKRIAIVLIGIALGWICREVFPPATPPVDESESPQTELRGAP